MSHLLVEMEKRRPICLNSGTEEESGKNEGDKKGRRGGRLQRNINAILRKSSDKGEKREGDE